MTKVIENFRNAARWFYREEVKVAGHRIILTVAQKVLNTLTLLILWPATPKTLRLMRGGANVNVASVQSGVRVQMRQRLKVLKGYF